MTQNYPDIITKAFLLLVRIGIGNEGPSWDAAKQIEHLSMNDWRLVKRLAEEQSVAAIAFDGLSTLFEAYGDIGKGLVQAEWAQLRSEWMMLSIQTECQYAAYEQSMADLADFYNKHGIKMMVLKGYGLSLNYPVPSHRPTGDLDIYLFGDQPKGDRLIEEAGIVVDYSHHHHTTFKFENLFVENHYDFLNIYSHQWNRLIERRLKELAKIGRPDDKLTNIYYPTAEFNSLFLLRHTGAHFAAERMTVRQLLDWAFCEKEVMEEEYKMDIFHHIIDDICNNYLGFNLPVGVVDKNMERRVLEDMLLPYSTHKLTPWFRLQRWFRNRWKNRLFYQENLFVTFWVQLWSHVVRPDIGKKE